MRDEDGDPYRLELLDPRKVRSRRDPKTYDLYYDLHGQSVYSGRSILLPENILHFKGLSVNGDDGLSPIQMATDELGTGIALSQYAGTLFGQGAVPNGVVECPPGWDETARTNFRQAVNDIHGGIKGANKVAILEEGAKWVATSFNPEQLQMLNARLFTIQEVGRVLGLPPHKLGDYSHDANRSLDEKNREYYQTSLEPYCDGIEEECALKLFTVAQRRVFFLEHDMSKLMRATELERAQTNDILMRNGVITGNEWRSDFGYNPFEEDIRIIPLNMGQVETGVDLDPNPNEGDPVDAPIPDDPEPLDVDDLEEQARAVLLTTLRRLVVKETGSIRKAAKRSEVSPEWIERFYRDHRAILDEALSPALRLYGIATRSKSDAATFLDRIIETSKTNILEAQSVEALLDLWERDRAEGLVNLFREEHQ